METQSSNDDIIAEILSWLPAKSLLMFETLSKGWHKTITDKSFRRLQCQREKVTISGFFMQDMYDLSKKVMYIPSSTTGAIVNPKSWDFLAGKIEIASSSNGLLCCHTSSSMSVAESFIYICNPASKEYIQIEWPTGGNYCENFALAFDSSCNSMDKFSNFKLVSVRYTGSPGFSFQMFSPKTKEWRKLDRCLGSLGVWVFPLKVVFASGVLYWMTPKSGILALDVETEQPYSLPFPDPWNHQIEDHHGKCIGESEGRLHCILICNGSLQMWCLDTERKWELKQLVPLSAMEEEYPHFLYNEAKIAADLAQDCLLMPTWIEPLAFKDGTVLLKLRSSFIIKNKNVIEACTKLYLYNIGSTKSLEELCTFDDSSSQIGYFKAAPYTMTLAPLEYT